MARSLEEARQECRDVGKGIEKLVAEGGDLLEAFEGTQQITFRVTKDCNEIHLIGGTLGGDDSRITVSEMGTWKTWNDEIVGYAFDRETRAALLELFSSLYNA